MPRSTSFAMNSSSMQQLRTVQPSGAYLAAARSSPQRMGHVSSVARFSTSHMLHSPLRIDDPPKVSNHQTKRDGMGPPPLPAKPARLSVFSLDRSLRSIR